MGAGESKNFLGLTYIPDNKNADSTLSTFVSMEKFGSCGSSIFIVILLIIIMLIGFVLYTNKDIIKIPTLHQRIANFGRQIKSIKRM